MSWRWSEYCFEKTIKWEVKTLGLQKNEMYNTTKMEAIWTKEETYAENWRTDVKHRFVKFSQNAGK